MTVLGAVALDGIRREQQAATRGLPLAPGVIVLVAREDYKTHRYERARPAVLVRRDDDDDHAWWVADLSASATYSDDRPRVPVVDWRACGLHGPGFHWGGRMRKVTVDDVTDRVGRIGQADAETVCDQHHEDLTVRQAAVFLAVCS